MEVQGLLAQRRAARAGSCGEAWAGLAAMGPLGGPGVVVGQRGRVFLPGRRTGPFSPVPGSDPGGTGGLKSGHRTTAKLCILPASGPKGLRRLCQSRCDPCQVRRPGEMHVTGASAEHFGPLGHLDPVAVLVMEYRSGNGQSTAHGGRQETRRADECTQPERSERAVPGGLRVIGGAFSRPGPRLRGGPGVYGLQVCASVPGGSHTSASSSSFHPHLSSLSLSHLSSASILSLFKRPDPPGSAPRFPLHHLDGV